MPVKWLGSLDATIAALVAEGKSQDQAVAIAEELARAGGFSKSIRAQILKARSEKQIAMAVTNVVADRDGNPVVDHQGDVMDISNLEDAFIKRFAKSGVDIGGTMHQREGGADVVEHFTISRDEWKALEPYIGMEIGVVKIRVRDQSMWAGVKDGTYPEVSIGGTGRREPI